MKHLSAIVGVLLFAALPTHATWELEAYYWLMTLDGDAAVGANGVNGTKIDLDSDLDYGDREAVPGVTLAVGDIHQFGINVFSVDVTSDTMLTRDITFDGSLYPAGSRISSGVDSTLVRGFYRFKAGNEKLSGGFIGGAQYIGLEGDISESAVGSSSEDISTGTPVIGVFAKGRPFTHVGYNVSLVGASWSIGDFKVAFVDFEAAIRAVLPPGVHAAIGYKHIGIDASDDRSLIDFDASLSGPAFYFGVDW